MSEQNNERPPAPSGAPALRDRAGRIIAAVGGLPLTQAEDVIRDISAHTRIKERHVAQLIVDWATSGRLPADLHSELRRQLDERRGAIRQPPVVTTEPTQRR